MIAFLAWKTFKNVVALKFCHAIKAIVTHWVRHTFFLFWGGNIARRGQRASAWEAKKTIAYNYSCFSYEREGGRGGKERKIPSLPCPCRCPFLPYPSPLPLCFCYLCPRALARLPLAWKQTEKTATQASHTWSVDGLLLFKSPFSATFLTSKLKSRENFERNLLILSLAR